MLNEKKQTPETAHQGCKKTCLYPTTSSKATKIENKKQ